MPGFNVMVRSDPVNRYWPVWAELANIPSIRMTATITVASNKWNWGKITELSFVFIVFLSSEPLGRAPYMSDRRKFVNVIAYVSTLQHFNVSTFQRAGKQLIAPFAASRFAAAHWKSS